MCFVEEQIQENKGKRALKGPAAHKKVSGQYVSPAIQQSVLSS